MQAAAAKQAVADDERTPSGVGTAFASAAVAAVVVIRSKKEIDAAAHVVLVYAPQTVIYQR
jgi:hypothetical protein